MNCLLCRVSEILYIPFMAQTPKVTINNYRNMSKDNTNYIWGENNFRVFLSHKATYKEETAKLKKELEKYGISAFVAHNDIEPTREWQNEIERALFSMDAFVALVTEDFNASEWTNQEIGFSYAFDIPRIYINLGDNPKGFAAKFQALSCSWENAPNRILKILLQESEQMLNAFIYNLEYVSSFALAEKVYSYLITLNLNKKQCDKVIYAYNNNNQLYECYKFMEILPYLKEWSGEQYKLNKFNKIEKI